MRASKLTAKMTGGLDVMDVMDVVGHSASVTQLMGNVTSSLSAIKQALSDMRELPTELDELKRIAEEGDRKFASVSKFLRRENEDRFRPGLESLSKDLEKARELQLGLAGNQNPGKDLIVALLGSGASEQLPRAKRLKASIKFGLDIVDGVIGELTHQNVNLVLESDDRRSGTFGSPSQAPKSEMVSNLESLSSRKTVEGSIIRTVSVAPSHSADYRDARGMSDVDEDEGSDDDLERGSVVGGYEVENNCKIRLTMEAGEQRFFYVVTFDSSNPEPQLFHPRIALAKNQLRKKSVSIYQRTFPTSYSDDPESWKLAKATALPTDEVERCFVYILFSRSRLEPDGQVATIRDVELKLNAAGSWSDEEEVIVECLRFDVK